LRDSLLSEPLHLTAMDSKVFIKAFAISLIVANHSGLGALYVSHPVVGGDYGLHGGLNVLLLLSGITMAQFSFVDTTSNTLRSLRRFALRLFIPSIVIAFLQGLLIRQQINIPELLFVSNWLSIHRVSSFPIWYPQAVLQMLLFISIVFYTFDLTPKIIKHPITLSLYSLAFSLFLALMSYSLWDTSYLQDKLPHLIAWNFVFGWLYWSLLINQKPTLNARIVLTTSLFLCAGLTFLMTGAIYGEARFVWFGLCGAVLIWIEKVWLPRAVYQVFSLISQATFYIFFMHYYVFSILRVASEHTGYKFFTMPIFRFLLAIGTSVVVWAFVAAVTRVLQRRNSSPSPRRAGRQGR